MFRPSAFQRPPRSRSSSFMAMAFKALLCVLVPGIGWLALNLGALEEYIKARNERDTVRAQVETVKAEIAKMEKEKGDLTVRGFADEAIARERLKLVKPGEKIVFLEWEDDLSPEAAAQ